LFKDELVDLNNTDTIESSDILSIETNNNSNKPIIRLYNRKNHHNHHHHHHTYNYNYNQTTGDETYTTNTTDMSDPHWDGYTSTTFYQTINNDNYSNCDHQCNEALLPWDDIFFELDSNDDFIQKFNVGFFLFNINPSYHGESCVSSRFIAIT
jgi:hypothetical protein